MNQIVDAKMPMPSLPGHQRNVSQGQQLIVDRQDDDEDVERCSGSIQPLPSTGIYTEAEEPHPYEPARPQENKAKGLFSDPNIRSNIKIILGSIGLTIVGAVLLVLGLIKFFDPDEGMQAWVFLFAGFLCFVPGFYHVFYIFFVCIGRPGYSFDRLPTFNR